MKELNKLHVMFFFMAFVVSANAQKSVLKIGNNPTVIGPSSVLELESDNKALLLPRVAGASLITAPVNGIIIYDEFYKCVRGYEDGAWSKCYNGNAVWAGHNLGADTSLDPHIPVQGIHGNYYQWGIPTPVADASTPPGPILGWNTTVAANGAWVNGSKTANDPCPTGFRVPTVANWDALIANYVRSSTGSWDNNATNFGAAAHWGPDVSTKVLTLPAAGFRSASSGNGSLSNRGLNGSYWSSTEFGFNSAENLDVNISSTGTDNAGRINGFSVRCISE